MHLRSSPGGGLLDPATPAIIRRLVTTNPLES